MLPANDFQASLQRLEKLLGQAEKVTDAAAGAQIRQVAQAILDLHALALNRLLEQLAESSEPCHEFLETAADDDIVGGLLLLHDLHPLDMETRVRKALVKVRPMLHSHHGDVELVAVEEGIVRLRLEGSCDGCPSSALTMKHTIEEAIYQLAPETVAVEVEGLPEEATQEEQSANRFALPLV